MEHQTLSEREIEFIKLAAAFLETPGFLIQAANALGKPLELMQKKLPRPVQIALSRATERALYKTLDISIATLAESPPSPQLRQPLWEGQKHTLAAATAGALGGFFGAATLALELPLTTGIIFRSIANIARDFGEDLQDPAVRMECLQIFAMGSPETSADDALNSSYFTQRLAFAAYLGNLAEKGSASLMSRLITRIASRYELVVTEKVLVEALPILGAVGGAVINSAFTNYFNQTSYYHFGLRRLERKYGTDVIRKIYLESLR